MNRCLRILLSADASRDFIESFVQKNAIKYEIEGVAHITGDHTVQIIACGSAENIDNFLDLIHQGTINFKQGPAIEPLVKNKDYRGVFRIIE